MKKLTDFAIKCAIAVTIYVLIMFCASTVGLAKDHNSWYAGAGIGTVTGDYESCTHSRGGGKRGLFRRDR